MSWSILKKRFRERMAPSVVKRVDFHTTKYRGHMHDDGRAWITWNGEEITNMAYLWDGFWSGLESDEESIYGQGRLGDAMFRYLNNSIDDILSHDNGLIRALGMLDRRVGKRRLQNMDVSNRPPLERLLYVLRCIADDVAIPEELETEQVSLRRGLKNKRLLHKRYGLRQQERHASLVEQADAELSQAGDDNLRQLIRESSGIDRDRLRTELGRTIHDGLTSNSNPDLARDMLLHVERVGSLLESPEYGKAVMSLSEFADQWIRPVEHWKPASKNKRRQFASLARHLLARFDVPAFMDAAWFGEMPYSRDWYCWIATGNNIRKAEHLPVKMTKSMAHHFLQAPDDYSIGAAFRWGQIQSLGGDIALCDTVAQSRLSRDFVDDSFWLSVFRFFVDNPMLDRAHVGPIVDFIWNRRFEPVVEFVERGVPVEREPVQPNFSMRGRTVDTLLRDVAVWHGELAENSQRPNLMWAKSPLPDFEYAEGSDERRQVWTIRELVSTEELIAEGKRMQHCVASFDRSCSQGKCSIWSMACQADGKTDPRLTIELGLPDQAIRQVRGLRNRLPTREEKSILARWVGSLGSQA